MFKKCWIRKRKEEADELAITSLLEEQVRRLVETEGETIFKHLNYNEMKMELNFVKNISI